MGGFQCRTEVVSGQNALDWLKQRQCETLLTVTDPYFMKNGWAERVAGLVQARKRVYFDGITPDPTVEQAAEGTALMRQHRPQLLLALGGGSTIDTAKAMLYFAGEGVHFAAIPTTSGSGSEVTSFAVLSHGEGKYPLIHRRLQPDTAILYPGLLRALPPALVAEGGFDVISHGVESFVATGADMLSRALAGNAFVTAFQHLEASYRGDTSVREQIHMASAMAGMAFSQSGLGLCHALSHSLGGCFHIPHGKLNAILLPEVIVWNAPAAGGLYAELARQAGLGGGTGTVGARNLRNGLLRLRKTLRLPQSLHEAGVSRQQLQQHRSRILEAALADPCLRTNPQPCTGEGMSKLLEAVSGHG